MQISLQHSQADWFQTDWPLTSALKAMCHIPGWSLNLRVLQDNLGMFENAGSWASASNSKALVIFDLLLTRHRMWSFIVPQTRWPSEQITGSRALDPYLLCHVLLFPGSKWEKHLMVVNTDSPEKYSSTRKKIELNLKKENNFSLNSLLTRVNWCISGNGQTSCKIWKGRDHCLFPRKKASCLFCHGVPHHHLLRKENLDSQSVTQDTKYDSLNTGHFLQKKKVINPVLK